MKHTRLTNNQISRKNLRKLANALLDPSVLSEWKFDMYLYTTCAIGFAFKVGIGKKDRSWDEYVNENLVKTDQNPGIFEYMFSHKWIDKDNTREGAGKRILYVLKHGIPENWRNQLHDSNTQLSYINE